jgi:4-hydroxybenzoate polyprenyltransferase/phosphoserine phosphatase
LDVYPLVVDLDGTLIRTDLMIESALAAIRTWPQSLFFPLQWFASGKARFKDRLAKEAKLSVVDLPYDPEVLALIREERAKGRQIILVTASHKTYAEEVASYLNLFDGVLVTEGVTNLAAQNKRDCLVEEFGKKGFDYVGNAHDDLPAWAMARHAILANPEPGVETKARALGNVQRVIATTRNPIEIWAKALRLHQWAKNLLLFVPLLASHQFEQVALLSRGLLAFLLFGLCSSSVYVLNDLLDLSDDRLHPRKSRRPFASGQLSLRAGIFAVPILLLAVLSNIWLLPWQFGSALAAYYGLSLAYCFSLKRAMGVDVIVLAMLYTLRIISGAFAVGVPLTFWMLAFSMFIFLSLALIKRYGELYGAGVRGRREKIHGRDYYVADREMIASLGAASGYLSVMVLALYIQDQATVVLYRYPRVIWLACPLLLFWISRTWLLAHRGRIQDDPVVFAVGDRVSWIVAIGFGVIFWLAA